MSNIKVYRADTQTAVELPFADEGVRAGFPSPAQDFMVWGIVTYIVHKVRV